MSFAWSVEKSRIYHQQPQADMIGDPGTAMSEAGKPYGCTDLPICDVQYDRLVLWKLLRAEI